MVPEVRVREIEDADFELVYALIQDTILESYSGVYPAEAIEFFQSYHSKKSIKNDAASGYTVVAESHGRLVGTGTLSGTNVRRVFVSPIQQHRGIGKVIEGELERKAASQKLPSLDLDSSLVSGRFWESMGFTKQKDDFIPIRNGKRLLYCRMAKSLRGSSSSGGEGR
jgi:GNAT superfamily N-acetyltransferase